MSNTLTLIRPDDWHVHLRDGEYLPRTVADISRYFGRAIVMPNLVPPVTNVDLAKAYYQRIKATQGNNNFNPLMTIYLTDNTTPQDIIDAKQSGIVVQCHLF